MNLANKERKITHGATEELIYKLLPPQISLTGLAIFCQPLHPALVFWLLWTRHSQVESGLTYLDHDIWKFPCSCGWPVQNTRRLVGCSNRWDDRPADAPVASDLPAELSLVWLTETAAFINISSFHSCELSLETLCRWHEWTAQNFLQQTFNSHCCWYHYFGTHKEEITEREGKQIFQKPQSTNYCLTLR